MSDAGSVVVRVVIFALILLSVYLSIWVLPFQKRRRKAVLRYLNDKPYEFLDRTSTTLQKIASDGANKGSMSDRKQKQAEIDRRIYNFLRDVPEHNFVDSGYKSMVLNAVLIHRAGHESLLFDYRTTPDAPGYSHTYTYIVVRSDTVDAPGYFEPNPDWTAWKGRGAILKIEYFDEFVEKALAEFSGAG